MTLSPPRCWKPRLRGVRRRRVLSVVARRRSDCTACPPSQDEDPDATGRGANPPQSAGREHQVVGTTCSLDRALVSGDTQEEMRSRSCCRASHPRSS